MGLIRLMPSCVVNRSREHDESEVHFRAFLFHSIIFLQCSQEALGSLDYTRDNDQFAFEALCCYRRLFVASCNLRRV